MNTAKYHSLAITLVSFTAELATEFHLTDNVIKFKQLLPYPERVKYIIDLKIVQTLPTLPCIFLGLLNRLQL